MFCLVRRPEVFMQERSLEGAPGHVLELSVRVVTRQDAQHGHRSSGVVEGDDRSPTPNSQSPLVFASGEFPEISPARIVGGLSQAVVYVLTLSFGNSAHVTDGPARVVELPAHLLLFVAKKEPLRFFPAYDLAACDFGLRLVD